MRLTLHPNDRDRLNVEVALSADEAEEWIARLQAAVRNAREGRGDQLLLLGEPARIVLTVQDRTPPGPDLPLEDLIPPETMGRDPFALAPAGVALGIALFLLLWLLLRFRILPL
jgi:hypothetical protein